MKDRLSHPKPPLERNDACADFKQDSAYAAALEEVTTNLEDVRDVIAGNHTNSDHPYPSPAQ